LKVFWGYKGRIENEKFVLDMRSIQNDEIEKLASIINKNIERLK